MKLLKKMALVLLLVLVTMQFYLPEKNSSQGDRTTSFLIETNPPKAVNSILQQSCYDCHSNATVYSWYHNIAPVSYWLASHVKDGKKHLNFSDWDSYSDKEKDHKLEEVAVMVSKGEMPLSEYTWPHKEAKLSQRQRDAIVQWAKRTRALYQLNRRPQ